MEQMLPLMGITVVDISTSYAGPFCSMLLGDMGADVIKVEKPGGDDARAWGPPFVNGESTWFLSVNRNKRSVCVDLTTSEGQHVLERLLSRADVFIENLKPSSLEKFGLAYPQVHRRFPGVVYVAISGFGLIGPESSRTGYDLIAQAMSGIMSVTGGTDGEPQRVGTALSDIVTGMMAALSVNAALVAKASTGMGCLIDIGLLDVDVALMTPRIVSYLASGEVPVANGGTDSVLAVYQKVSTATQPIVLATGTTVLWERLKDALGRPSLLESPEYDTNAGRQVHRAKIVSIIEDVLSHYPAEQWVETFRQYGVPAALINTLDAVVVEPQVLARGMIQIVEHPRAGPIALVGTPVHVNGGGFAVRTPPPLVGQHTVEILREMGYETEEIERLQHRGIVSGETERR
ncbi:MAG: CoA transferase [Sulfobacillus acidophilus]|uniref:CoA transferase n=1 Tax=Sulfobacillus acidophilus TaxID=53633 RepID=A0A2T2WNA6_9FIRM|nr:MAG: CoA transferase [Sulfobacillus acidophilus]